MSAPSPLFLCCSFQKTVATMARAWTRQDPTLATMAFRPEIWTAMQEIERAVQAGPGVFGGGKRGPGEADSRSLLGPAPAIGRLWADGLFPAAAGALRVPVAAEPKTLGDAGGAGSGVFRCAALLPDVQAGQGDDADGLPADLSGVRRCQKRKQRSFARRFARQQKGASRPKPPRDISSFGEGRSRGLRFTRSAAWSRRRTDASGQAWA